jgi:hypothetical protein
MRILLKWNYIICKAKSRLNATHLNLFIVDILKVYKLLDYFFKAWSNTLSTFFLSPYDERKHDLCSFMLSPYYHHTISLLYPYYLLYLCIDNMILEAWVIAALPWAADTESTVQVHFISICLNIRPPIIELLNYFL